MSKSRPSRDSNFLAIAEVVSEMATCPRASVGAILVLEGRIIATGYNGAPAGRKHCTEVGCLMEDNHCQRAIHAETNAIAQAATSGTNCFGATMYVYSSRGDEAICRECNKIVLSAGIFRVVINNNEYRYSPSVESALGPVDITAQGD